MCTKGERERPLSIYIYTYFHVAPQPQDQKRLNQRQVVHCHFGSRRLAKRKKPSESPEKQFRAMGKRALGFSQRSKAASSALGFMHLSFIKSGRTCSCLLSMQAFEFKNLYFFDWSWKQNITSCMSRLNWEQLQQYFFILDWLLYTTSKKSLSDADSLCAVP